jgi:hypothetical protein
VYQVTEPATPGPGRPRIPARQPLPGQLVIAGAHGGAGASTLAALLEPAWDLGTVAVPARRGRPLPPGLPVVLAVRCTVASAARAIAAVDALAGQGAVVAVLAVTGDGLPEPAEASYRFGVLEGRVGGLVRVPFIPALRAAGDPRQVRLPRGARRALAQIRDLAAWPGGLDPPAVTRP